MRQQSLICPSYQLLNKCLSKMTSRQLHMTSWQTNNAGGAIDEIMLPDGLGRLCCRPRAASFQMGKNQHNTQMPMHIEDCVSALLMQGHQDAHLITTYDRQDAREPVVNELTCMSSATIYIASSDRSSSSIALSMSPCVKLMFPRCNTLATIASTASRSCTTQVDIKDVEEDQQVSAACVYSKHDT